MIDETMIEELFEEWDRSEAELGWTYWAKMGFVPLWKAICLSFNWLPTKKSIIEPEFTTRLTIVRSYVDVGTPPFEIHFGQYPDLYIDAKVNLMAFGDWAQSVGFNLPREFPTSNKTKDTDPDIVALSALPIGMRILCEGWREAQGLGVIKDKDRVKDIFRRRSKEARYSAPESAFEEWATIATPDETAKGDKRSRLARSH